MKIEDYDWRTREDGDTLVRAAEIQGDPERLAMAQAYLNAQQSATRVALGKKPTGSAPSRRNKATIGSLPQNF